MKMKVIGVILTVLAGCTLADVKVEVISERTALENQVLGSYNTLDAQMLLTASVRGVDSSGNIARPPAHSREYKDTLRAMQTIDFHADDLERFKRLGWVGENNQGLVESFGMTTGDVPTSLLDFAENYSTEEFEHVLSQINHSREKIMLQVIYMNENLQESDLPEVRTIFATLNRNKAGPGDKIQTDTGKWVTR
jgi:hypothetical protein